MESNNQLSPIPPLQSQGQERKMCVLSVILIILGVIVMLAGFYAGANYVDYPMMGNYGVIWRTNNALRFGFIFGGIVMGMFSFAMAVIVDACQKYRMTH